MRDWKGVPAVSWMMVGFAVVMTGAIAYLAVQGKLSSEVTGALISALVAVVVTHLAHVSGQALAYRRLFDDADLPSPSALPAPTDLAPDPDPAADAAPTSHPRSRDRDATAV